MTKKDLNKNSEIAISVKNVSKTFRIPHERITSLRGAAVNVFKKSTYEEFKALDNVSFEVKKGEFFGIIGRNGSGKSTLLKILAGIYQPDIVKKGKVHPMKSAKGGAKQFHGVKVNGMISPFLELGIGFNPELSGRDNVYLNATVLGMTKKQIDEKFDSIVKFSELERFIDQKLKNYSSGMSVRLAFSVSIHANREILLMDEVLAVGDTNFQSKCLEEFNKYKEMGRTVIIVTHDIPVVERYCDRAMLIRNGKIEEIGEAENVTNKYIQENIMDEEERISKLKTYPSLVNSVNTFIDSKKNKKMVEIIKVEFLNKENNIKNVFQTGDDIVARIFYRANKEIENPVFGVEIFTQDGILIASPNTKTSNFHIESIRGEGFIDFNINQNPFFVGAYFLTVAIYNKEHITPYDFHDKEFIFNIQSKDENQIGIIKVKHEWRK